MPVQRVRPKVGLPTGAALACLSAVDRHLLSRVLEEQAECVYNVLFERSDAAELLRGPLTPERLRTTFPCTNDDSGADMLVSTEGQPLNIDAERHSFLCLNYARHRVVKTLREFHAKRLTLEATRTLLTWQRVAMEARNEIVRANLPLVLAMVKRTKITGVDYADLISEGNLALMRSVDKFDCARGYKFSTYACRAILKAFARVASRTARYRGHFPTEFDPTLEKSDFLEQRRTTLEGHCIDELKSVLGGNAAELSDVEQRVITARFALDQQAEEASGRTLEEVGRMIGVTKERVRQIQNKALLKLRAVLEGGVLAV
jgi:RNA polymerase primary sigma factor